ncbi:hypothetical protein IFM89_006937, partial [Coptis chinensis]
LSFAALFFQSNSLSTHFHSLSSFSLLLNPKNPFFNNFPLLILLGFRALLTNSREPFTVSEMDGCDFGFNYMIDEMEEDALNRKYCTDVLRRLIAKADTDIEELEAEVLVLETELAGAENNNYTDFIDLCCEVLGEKNKTLELSISSLKNENNPNDGNDNVVHLVKDTEPVQTIPEIIKALISKVCKDENEQHADIIVEEEGSDATRHSIRQSNQKKNLNMTGSSPMETEEVRENNVTHKDISPRLHSLLEPEKMITCQPDGQHAGAIVEEDRSDVMRHSISQPDHEQKLNRTGSSPMEREEVRKSNVTRKEIGPRLHSSSSEPKKMITNQPEKVKSVRACVAETRNTEILKSPSLLQRQTEKNVTKCGIEVQETKNFSTDKAANGKSSLKSRRQKAEEKIQSGKNKIQVVADTCASDLLKSSAGQQERSIAQPKRAEVKETRTLKYKRQRVKSTINSKNATNSKKHKGNDATQKEVAEILEDTLQAGAIVVYNPGVTSTAENGKKSSKGNRKRPNQVDGLGFTSTNNRNNSKFTAKKYERKRKAVSSSNGTKERSAGPTFVHYSLDSVFKSWDDEMNIMPLAKTYEEPPKLLCYTAGRTTMYDPETSKSFDGGHSHDVMSGALVGPLELGRWSIIHLRSLAKERGMRGYSKLNKYQLVQLLTKVD